MTAQIIDYMVLTASSSVGENLVLQVKRSMELGWEPLGGHTIATTDNECVMSQSMVKYHRGDVEAQLNQMEHIVAMLQQHIYKDDIYHG